MSFDAQALALAVMRGEVRAAARACRIVDDELPGSVELLRLLYPASGKGVRIGVTGNPGAGKSTLVDRLVELLRRENKRVAVVAVDPTSPFSGGAVLGDRIRMQRHFGDDEVFIRSVATRGALGGLSRTALDVARVLEAWGAQVTIIETVGVGQDELDVIRVLGSTLVVVPPGLGDDIQATKAGLLEVADVFAVNKADRSGADSTVRDLQGMLALGQLTFTGGASDGQAAHSAHGAHAFPLAAAAATRDEWQPPVLKTVATTGEGLQEVLTALVQHSAWLTESQAGKQRQQERVRLELIQRLRDTLLSKVMTKHQAAIDAQANAVANDTSDPYSACAAIVRLLEL